MVTDYCWYYWKFFLLVFILFYFFIPPLLDFWTFLPPPPRPSTCKIDYPAGAETRRLSSAVLLTLYTRKPIRFKSFPFVRALFFVCVCVLFFSSLLRCARNAAIFPWNTGNVIIGCPHRIRSMYYMYICIPLRWFSLINCKADSVGSKVKDRYRSAAVCQVHIDIRRYWCRGVQYCCLGVYWTPNRF